MLDARSLLRFGLILVCVSGLPADPPKSSCNQPRCEDSRDAVPEFAFNPLDPMRAYHQHPAFRRFIVQSTAFDPRYIFEAFGVRVDYHYDCTVIKKDIFASVDAVLHERAKVGLREYDALAYRKVVPSRSLACLQHEARGLAPLARTRELERHASVRTYVAALHRGEGLDVDAPERLLVHV